MKNAVSGMHVTNCRSVDRCRGSYTYFTASLSPLQLLAPECPVAVISSHSAYNACSLESDNSKLTALIYPSLFPLISALYAPPRPPAALCLSVEWALCVLSIDIKTG